VSLTHNSQKEIASVISWQNPQRRRRIAMQCFEFSPKLIAPEAPGVSGVFFPTLTPGILLNGSCNGRPQLDLGYPDRTDPWKSSYLQLSVEAPPTITDGRIFEAGLEKRKSKTGSYHVLCATSSEPSFDLLVHIKGFGGPKRNGKSSWLLVKGSISIKAWHANGSKKHPRNDGLVVLSKNSAVLVSMYCPTQRVVTRWVLKNINGNLEIEPWLSWLEMEVLRRRIPEDGGRAVFTTDHEKFTFVPGIEITETINGSEVKLGNLLEGEEDDRPWIPYFGSDVSPKFIAFLTFHELLVMVPAKAQSEGKFLVRVIPNFARNCFRHQRVRQGNPVRIASGLIRDPSFNGESADDVWVLGPEDEIEVIGKNPSTRVDGNTEKLFGILNTGTQIKGT
jgi:hypothetical protein